MPVNNPGLRQADHAACRRASVAAVTCLMMIVPCGPATANNYSESLAWQFRTAGDRATQAAILDLIERRRGGYFAAPIYNTNIARQNNCSIVASASGNTGNQSALANSPSVTGPTSTSTGNADTTALNGRAGSVTSDQNNSGTISSGVIGGTNVAVSGAARQALNSTQGNSGDQSAAVDRSSACAFEALN